MSPRTESQGRLSVGFLVQNFPVYSETFVAELADGLVGQGCSLEILALDGRNPTPSGWPHLRRLTRRPPPWPPVPGAPGRGLDIVRQALLLASRPRYDVVHCQFATQGLAALRHRRLGTLRTAALVVHLRGHDITTFVNERGPGIYRDLFRRADLFIANCAYFRDRAVSLGCAEDKIVVIGSPVDTDRFAPPARRAPPAGRPTQLVAVGRLVEKKGFADAIAAVSHLRAVGFDVRLDILGDGPLHAPLAARVMDLGVGDVVTLHGAATQEQVIAALHGADIALTPSVRAASGDEDATVNTAKEAMATGLPVIGTFHGGIPELVIPGENGDLVPERDPSALAAAIARMLDDQTKWAALGAAGRKKVVTEYARTGIVAKTLVAYDLALRRAGARV